MRSARRWGQLPGQAGWTRWDKVEIWKWRKCINILTDYRLLWRGGVLRWADWTPDWGLWGGRPGPSPLIPSRQDEANRHLINNFFSRVWSLLNKVNVESDTKWSMAHFLLLLAICEVLLPCPVHPVSLCLGRMSTGAVTINYQNTLDILLNVTA